MADAEEVTEPMGKAQQPTPSPAGRQDVAVLIGWAAILESALVTGELPEALDAKVRLRLIDAGLLAQEASQKDLLQAINDLNQRLRYTLGEYANDEEAKPTSD
jgi:hypothetical protein